MPRFRRFSLLAAAMLLLTGCDPADLFLTAEDSAAMISDHKEQRYDTDSVRTMVSELQSAWNSDDRETVRSLVDRLTGAVDDASAVFLKAEIGYYTDWNNKDRAALRDQTMQDYCETAEMVRWAFANGSRKSRYAELFEPLIQPENTDYYLANSLSRVCSGARSEANSSSERLDEYYQTAYSSESDSAQTNEACAALYLETVKALDTDDLLYEHYARDYTPNEASSAWQVIRSEIVPLYRSLYDSIRTDKRYNDLADKKFAVSKPFEVIQKHAAAISPQLAESAEKLLGESLYTVASGENCYDGSYTVNFPKERSARIYFYQGSDFYDFSSAVHEFGHFHGDWRDQTPTLLQKTCIDIAEIQSQGLEMLYTSFYDDIYGADAGYLELIQIFNMLDSVITGFSVGEFERDVMQHKDSYTAEDVQRIFGEYKDQTGFTLELYQVTHLYEQPGYYISYGVSALAALQIYTAMLQDFRKGTDLYEKIAEIPTFSGEYKLEKALRQCGFDDLFSADSIRSVAENLTARTQAIAAQ